MSRKQSGERHDRAVSNEIWLDDTLASSAAGSSGGEEDAAVDRHPRRSAHKHYTVSRNASIRLSVAATYGLSDNIQSRGAS
jgi:hypothetical protein